MLNWALEPNLVTRLLITSGQIKNDKNGEHLVSDAGLFTKAQSWPWGGQIPDQQKKHLNAGKAIAEQRLVSKARNKSKEQDYEHPRPWRRSDVFIDNFEHISHVFLVFLLLILKKLMFDGQ